MRLRLPLCLALAFLSCVALGADGPQSAGDATRKAVLAADAHYWRTFNACDLQAMAPLLTGDVEFYHDKTGLTVTRQGVLDSLRKGPCADPSMHLRREAIAGSVRFHPLAGGFALLTGRHRFVVEKDGEAPHVDGQAAFAAVWQWAAGQWRMRRIVSYDHAPVPYAPPPSHLALTREQARRLIGRYRTEQSGDLTVTGEGDHLRLVSGSLSVTLFPVSAQRFAAQERDLQFEFEGGPRSDGHAASVIIYEHGSRVATGTRVD